MYIPKILDVQKVLEDARKKSAEGLITVHFHAEDMKCEGWDHRLYKDSLVIDEWGKDHGTKQHST
jgi:hypothetical protein